MCPRIVNQMIKIQNPNHFIKRPSIETEQISFHFSSNSLVQRMRTRVTLECETSSPQTLFLSPPSFFSQLTWHSPILFIIDTKKKKQETILAPREIFCVTRKSSRRHQTKEKAIEACKHFLVERFDWFRPATSAQTPPPAVKDPKDISDIFLFTEKWLEIFPITLRTNFTLDELTNWLLNGKIESLWGFCSILPLCVGGFVKDFHSIGSAERKLELCRLVQSFSSQEIDDVVALPAVLNCSIDSIVDFTQFSCLYDTVSGACQYSNMLLTK